MHAQSARPYRCHRFFILALSSATTATLLFLFLLVNAAHGEPAAPGSIHGQVRDETGRPLSDTITVVLYAYPFQITNTNGFLQAIWLQVTAPDEAGFYAFTTVPSGVYRVGFYDVGTSTCSIGACDACAFCFYRHYAAQFYSTTLDLATAQDILVMGETITGIDATMQRGGTLKGTVALSNVVDHTVTGAVTLYRYTSNGWQVAEKTSVPTYATPTFTPTATDFYFSGLAPGRYRLCATLRHTYPDDYPVSAVLLWTGCYQRPETAGQATAARMDDLLALEPIASATDISVTAASILTNLNIVVTPFLPDPLPDVAGIGGKVTSTDNRPLPGIQVTAYLSQPTNAGNRVAYTYTNQLGDYRLRLTTGGAYILNFSEPAAPYDPTHYLSTYYQEVSTFDKATLLPWQPGQTLPNIDVTLHRWSQITGTVKLTGGYVAEFAGIDVYRQGAAGWALATTQNSLCSLFCAGEYNLHTGDYRLLLEPGIYRLAATVRIKGQRLTRYYGGATLAQATDLLLQSEQQIGDINIELDAERFETSLRGQVMADGAPRAGVRVEVYNYGSGRPFVYVTTGTDGTYAVTGLLAGLYLVRALAPDPPYASLFYGNQPVSWAAQPITITPAAPGLPVDLNLSHAGALDGNLRRFDGQPLSGATVWLHWYTGDAGWEQQLPVVATLTDAQGHWAVQGLLPGVYRVRYQHDDFWPRSIPYGTLDVHTNRYTPSDLTIKPDNGTHAAMTIAAGYLRTPTTQDDRAQLFLPLVTR